VNFLYIIPILAFLIIIHEFGHFFSARAVGVKVEEFGIGIPPRVRGWRWRGVLWSINAIPFGGFVRVLGEDGKSMEPGSMNTKSPGQRAFFLAAGSAMNLLAAVVLMIILVGYQGIPAGTNVYIGQVESNTPAAVAGWQVGDQIVEVAGVPVDDVDELRRTTNDFAGEPMSVVLLRGNQRIETEVVPREDPPAGQGRTGVVLNEPQLADVNIASVLPDSPVAQAGLQAGDRIVSINGREISDSFILRFELERALGQTVPIVVERTGEQIETQLTLPLPGPLVTDVPQDSPAAVAGLMRGDRIDAINGQPAGDPSVVNNELNNAQGSTVTLTISRGGEQLEVTLAVPPVTNENESVFNTSGLRAAYEGTLDVAGFSAKAKPRFDSVSAAQVIPQGFRQSYGYAVDLVHGFRELVTSREQWDQVAGPIGMG
jgi:regulator of sigma E protease